MVPLVLLVSVSPLIVTVPPSVIVPVLVSVPLTSESLPVSVSVARAVNRD